MCVCTMYVCMYVCMYVYTWSYLAGGSPTFALQYPEVGKDQINYSCPSLPPSLSGHPVMVPLPGPATQIACGDNHTVILTLSGEVFTFGKHQEGQLGRKKEEGDDDAWHMTPRPVALLGDECKVAWVGARGNQTFISVDESLVSEVALSKCRVFASSQSIGWPH